MAQPITPVPVSAQPVLGPNGAFSVPWYLWLQRLAGLLGGGFTGTITTAKLTTGGANGSMTFQNGVLVAQTAAS